MRLNKCFFRLLSLMVVARARVTRHQLASRLALSSNTSYARVRELNRANGMDLTGSRV